MKPDAEVLEEVVVTGMQKMDKRLFTGAATKLDAEGVKLNGMQISAVVLKAVLRVCQSRMYPVHLVQLPKSAFAVLPPFMVAPNHYGWWMELLWKMLLMWDLM